MTYQIEFTDLALKDIKKLKKSGNSAVLKKLRRLLNELREHPQSGTGKPERLKHDFNGYWSRRINKEHRLIYAIEEQRVVVVIISAFGHYET